MGAAAFAGADRSDPPRSVAEAAALEAPLRAGQHHRCDGACVEAEWRISFRQRHRRLLRLDAGASLTLARFRLDRGARVRLADTVERLHDDAIRTQSRARRPPRRVFAVSESRLLRMRTLMVRSASSRVSNHEATGGAASRKGLYHFVGSPIRALRMSVASHTMRPPRSRPSNSIGSRLSMCPNCPL